MAVFKKQTLLKRQHENLFNKKSESFNKMSHNLEMVYVPNFVGNQTLTRPLVKSAYQKFDVLISKPEHILWVLKRNVSMRRFF